MTRRMVQVLQALADEKRAMTPNNIARKIGFHTGQDAGRHSHNGRSMAPAQRVIGPLTRLRARGLVSMGSRSDGLSGTAYAITESGRAELKLWKEKPQ
jgi:DNA-binding PadR family transcriptional regulator